jgi:hypothetical protein
MTLNELNEWAAENGLGPDTEITFSDFSGHGMLHENKLDAEGIDDPVMGKTRTLNIDVT